MHLYWCNFLIRILYKIYFILNRWFIKWWRDASGANVKWRRLKKEFRLKALNNELFYNYVKLRLFSYQKIFHSNSCEIRGQSFFKKKKKIAVENYAIFKWYFVWKLSFFLFDTFFQKMLLLQLLCVKDASYIAFRPSIPRMGLNGF